jgi:succinyl-diaminopimelate desuccinylase
MLPYGGNDEVLRLARDLISCPSHKDAPGREAAVARLLVEWFGARGVAARLESVEGERANVVAEVDFGPGPTLMLNGHLDTVPAGEMREPFTPRIEGGLLWGRGACDMKGAVAAMCCALVELQRRWGSGAAQGRERALLDRCEERLEGRLVFVGTADEETGSRGAKGLMESGLRADYAVVGEPTGLRVGTAHKGSCFVRIELVGRGAHGSRPELGVNAAVHAARLAVALEGTLRPRLSERNHPLLGTSTLSVGRICGGTQVNVVAERCELLIDRRYVPGEEHPLDELRRFVEEYCKEVPGLSASIEETAESATIPHGPLNTDSRGPLVRAAVAALAEVLPEAPSEPVGLSYWTDGGHFAACGIRTIVLGPGDIAYAHGPNEHVPLESLVEATQIYAGLAVRVLKSHHEQL